MNNAVSQNKIIPKKSLKRRIIGYFSVAVVGMMFVVIGIVAAVLVEELRDGLRTSLSSKAYHVLKAMDQRVAFLVESVDNFSNNHFIINSLIHPQGRWRYLSKLVDDFGRLQNIDSVSIVDYAGNFVYSTLSNPPNYQKILYLMPTLETGKKIIAMAKGSTHIVIIEPIQHYRTPIGAVISEIGIADLISQILPEEACEYYKVYCGGKLILSHQFEDNLSYVVQEQIPGKKLPYLNTLRIKVEMGALQSKHLKPVRKIIYQLIGIGGVFLVIAIALSLKIGNSLARPILKLCKKATQPETTKGERYSPVGTGDELEELAQVLDRREAELQLSKEYVDNIIKSMADTLIVVSPDATIRTVNQATLNLLGYEEQELIGKSAEAIIGKEEQGLFIGTCIEELIKKDFIKGIERIYLSKDSRKIPVLFSGSVMRDDEGKIQGIVCVALDITERKLAEEALRKAHDELEISIEERTSELSKANENLRAEITERKKAEKEREQLLCETKKINQELRDFVYITSHDLKTPVRAIGTLAEWISEDYKDKLNDAGKKYLNLLLKRTRHLDNMIDDIHQYSRVTGMKMKHKKIDTYKMVEKIIDSLSSPENVRFQFQDKLPEIFTAPLQFNVVFENLIGNAVKFMDKPEGIIEIGCQDLDSFWQFYVKDNGPGIENRYFDRIFQIFKTIKPSVEFESTGMGLTIVKKIVEQNGGEVSVESEVGKGSTFRFTLPKAQS